MPAVRTIADGRDRWYLLTTKPTAPVLATITAGTDISCDIAKTSYIRATASETVADARLCDTGNAPAFGAGAHEGLIAPFLMLDSVTGVYAAATNAVFEAFKLKGTTAYIVKVTGIPKGATLAAGHLTSAYEVVSDTPQDVEQAGYVKRNIPLSVTPIWEEQIVTAT